MTQVTDLVVDLLPLAGRGLTAAQLLLLLWLLLGCLVLAAQRVGGVVTAGCARVRRMLRSKKDKIVKLTDTVQQYHNGLESAIQMWSQ
jgi:hypothetical protein